MLDNLDIIKNEVTKLKDKTNHDDIVKQLQKINECFVQNVIIKINNRLEIYPVEVESYYYDNKGIFQDGNCHQNVLQKNNFGKLYFHRASRSKNKDNLIDTSYYGGVDVCISNNDDYYLSVLIRSAYIKSRKEEGTKKEFITGIHRIVNRITDELENLLEEGKIDFEYDIYEDEETKKEQLKKEISKFEYKHRKRIYGKNFFKHEEEEKKKYDEYELNTYIEDIKSKIVQTKEEDINSKTNNNLTFK